MKKSVLKKQLVIITLILSLTLTACDVSEIGSLIEVENQTEQFDKMTEELSTMPSVFPDIEEVENIMISFAGN